jgi:CubicO group peptidase (beta-lactamase class C family)
VAQDEAVRLQRAFQRIDALAQRTMQDSGTPGMAVAITSREGLLHIATYGYANKDSREPVTPETLFGAGSIGKSFTAVALLELRDSGKLDLQVPVSRYLPWFKVNATTAVTAHHLLTHTAGFPDMRMELMSTLYQAFWLTQCPVPFEPGKQYHYSSSGYDVLSVLIAARSGRSFAEAIRQGIFVPLEMNHSEPVFTTRIRPRLAVSYEPLYDDRPADTRSPLVTSNWYEYGGGAGSEAVTAGDLAAYLRTLLNRGAGTHGPVLSQESFRLLTQHAVSRGPNRYYGYGLEVTEEDGHVLIGHAGGVQGFRSMMLGDLDDGLGVVVLVNSPLPTSTVAQFALKAVEAACHQRPLPDLPAADEPSTVPDASEFEGRFAARDGSTLIFRARANRLEMLYQGQATVLERRGPDTFYCRHPDFSLFLLRFGREKGMVTEVSHGPRWYANEQYAGLRVFEYPHDWEAYAGHYRTATRHHINFRIVLRKGTLFMVGAGGDENPLRPLDAERFRVADFPEWLRFDTVVNGQALRVNYSGSDYHRDFTP